MKEYLINSGEFNILVRPEEKAFYMLDDIKVGNKITEDFVAGKKLDLKELAPMWFKYRENEEWEDFDGQISHLGEDFSEEDLIDRFVLKRFNFGGLVAERDLSKNRIKVYKKEKLHIH